jgi:hypothetical protein
MMNDRELTVPAIGETISTARARALCIERGAAFHYIITRIDAESREFKDWVFDGASLLPDKVIAKLFRIPHLTAIALEHDLKYAYGELGNQEERLEADRDFKKGLLADGARPWAAEIMFKMVRLGGSEKWKTSFSWGFARIRR